MSMLPLISVTVVTYNHKDFIEECLDSIITQDYPNLEICVADDCSTDGTSEIVKKYAENYPKIIKFIEGKINVGPTKNCNLALMAITGQYCAMTAGDDIMLPGKLRSQVEFMEANPNCRISYHDSAVTDTQSGKIIAYSKELSYSGDGTFETLLAKGSFIGACTAMFRTEFMPKNRLDERLEVGADWKLHLDILETGGYVMYLDHVFAKHLRHANNITTGKNPEIELKRFQDVMTTCGLILCKHPRLAKIIKRRMSAVLREMRNIHGAKNYSNYLSASLTYNYSIKSVLGLLLGKTTYKR